MVYKNKGNPSIIPAYSAIYMPTHAVAMEKVNKLLKPSF